MSEPAVYARALAQLRSRVPDLDPLTTPFAQLKKQVSVDDKATAIGLAAMFAARMIHELGAFWFPQRELALGAALGLPSMLLALDPLELVHGDLDERLQELRRAGARAPSPGEPVLDAKLYRATFDPRFLQFLVVDSQRVRDALSLPAGRAGELVRDALAGVEPLQADALDDAWAKPLLAIDRNQTLADHAGAHPRAVEAFVRLYAGITATAPATEELWADDVFPKLVGKPDEPRLLGAFRPATTTPLVDVRYPRLHRVDPNDLRPAARPGAGDGPGDQSDPASELMAMLPRLALGSFELVFRRMTENELPREAVARVVSGRLLEASR